MLEKQQEQASNQFDGEELIDDESQESKDQQSLVESEKQTSEIQKFIDLKKKIIENLKYKIEHEKNSNLAEQLKMQEVGLNQATEFIEEEKLKLEEVAFQS